MIKKLRYRFILLMMVVISVILGAVVTVINIASYNRINREAEVVLNILAENEGKIPGNFDEEDEDRPPSYYLELPYSTRYFTVTINLEGEVQSANLNYTRSVNYDGACAIALRLYQNKNKEGIYESFKYRSIKLLDESTMYIFLDQTSELENYRYLLLFSIIGSIGGLAIFFIMSVILSKFVLRPVENSYKNQKVFITNASHELKTPLTIINANTEIIEMNDGESEWTESIKSQVSRLTNLTNQLVYITKLDEDSIALNKKEFNLSKTIIETLNSFTPVLKNKKISLLLDIKDDIKYVGDEKLITDLIIILIDNLSKYTSGEMVGSVKLDYKKIRNKLSKIEFVIANSIDFEYDEDPNMLFERFFRLDNSRNRKTGGTGVGLSIAKNIVDLHKGNISINIENNNQIIFTIIL